MNIKILLGAIITGVITFLLCWLFFGVLLEDYYETSIVQYPGLIKKAPEVWFIASANLLWGLLLSWIFSLGRIYTAIKGFTTGLFVAFLNILGFDLFFYAQLNIYPLSLIGVDVAMNTIMGGIGGTVLGWWMGRTAKE